MNLWHHFAVSGVETWLWLPPLAALVISFCTSMVGISGAFLLLPFQLAVLGFASPAASATNLVFNLVAIPGALWRYGREGRLFWPLALAVTAGGAPGTFAGAWLRTHWLAERASFEPFVAAVLAYLAWRLFADRRSAGATAPVAGVRLLAANPWEIRFAYGDRQHAFGLPSMLAFSFLVGVIGTAYGIGGGSFIVPLCLAWYRLPLHAIAGATLAATFLTSAFALAAYTWMPAPAGVATRPDWALGIAFGLGGLAGAYLGARAETGAAGGIAHFPGPAAVWTGPVSGLAGLKRPLQYGRLLGRRRPLNVRDPSNPASGSRVDAYATAIPRCRPCRRLRAVWPGSRPTGFVLAFTTCRRLAPPRRGLATQLLEQGGQFQQLGQFLRVAVVRLIGLQHPRPLSGVAETFHVRPRLRLVPPQPGDLRVQGAVHRLGGQRDVRRFHDDHAEGGNEAFDLLVQFRHLLPQHLRVMVQALCRQVGQVVGVDLFDFQLQVQEIQEVAGLIGPVGPLHEGGLDLPLGLVGLPVRVQGAGQLAIDLADRLAGFLSRLLTPGRRRFAFRALAPGARRGLLLPLVQLPPGLLHHFFQGFGAVVAAQLDAHELLHHGLGQDQILVLEVGVGLTRMPVMEGFQFGVGLFQQQVTGQVQHQTAELAALVLALGAAGLGEQFVQQACHLLAGLAVGFLGGQQLVGQTLPVAIAEGPQGAQGLAPNLQFGHQVAESGLGLVGGGAAADRLHQAGGARLVMTPSSSRTLPGQSYPTNRAMVSAAMPRTPGLSARP